MLESGETFYTRMNQARKDIRAKSSRIKTDNLESMSRLLACIRSYPDWHCYKDESKTKEIIGKFVDMGFVETNEFMQVRPIL